MLRAFAAKGKDEKTFFFPCQAMRGALGVECAHRIKGFAAVSAFLYFLAGIVTGGVTTWLTSRHYYKQATIDLRTAEKGIQQALGAIGYLVQYPGTKAEVQRDSNGNITGVLVHAAGTATLSFSAHATATVTNSCAVSSMLGPLSSGAAIAPTDNPTLRTSR